MLSIYRIEDSLQMLFTDEVYILLIEIIVYIGFD